VRVRPLEKMETTENHYTLCCPGMWGSSGLWQKGPERGSSLQQLHLGPCGITRTWPGQVLGQNQQQNTFVRLPELQSDSSNKRGRSGVGMQEYRTLSCSLAWCSHGPMRATHREFLETIDAIGIALRDQRLWPLLCLYMYLHVWMCVGMQLGIVLK
jgi:hypothetical protein